MKRLLVPHRRVHYLGSMLKDTILRHTAPSMRLKPKAFRLICLAIAGIAVSGAVGWAFGHSLAQKPHYTAVEQKAGVLPSRPASVSDDGGNVPGTAPSLLSAVDVEIYREAFAAQKRGDWTKADNALATSSDSVLRGHLLADRYRHRKYNTSYAELTAWLQRYRDHPEAQNLYALALNKKPAGTWLRLEMERPRKLAGYGEEASVLATTISDNPIWREGLNAWRQGSYARAADRFMQLSSQPKPLPVADKAAVNYWAWRALTRKGDTQAAKRYLAAAAQAPRTFYGILARKQLGQPLELARRPAPLSKAALRSLYEIPAVKRIVALSQVGLHDRAEAEMRQLFPASPLSVQKQLIVLASELRLSAVQIRMAQALGRDKGYDYALYPMPSITPREGFAVAPELIFAVARAESGFHAKAESEAGALGLMQIMPTTANYVAKRDKMDLSTLWPKHGQPALSEPVMNVTLGQSYIRYLLDQPNIRGNLFYLAAAYNAGPGKLSEWQRSIRCKDDPLLFVESIPYSETRRYISRVMTTYWIYSDMQENETATVAMVANDEWPVYDGIGMQDLALLSN